MFILLTADTAAAAGSMGSMLPLLIAMFALMYFMVIRPENKRKRQAEEMRNSLSVGEEITTIGGMVGKIVHHIHETRFMERDHRPQRLHHYTFVDETLGQKVADGSQMIDVPQVAPEEFAGTHGKVSFK